MSLTPTDRNLESREDGEKIQRQVELGKNRFKCPTDCRYLCIAWQATLTDLDFLFYFCCCSFRNLITLVDIHTDWH